MALKRIPIPVKVDPEDQGKRIVVVWQDGRKDVLNAFDLRAECPCAVCVDEISGKRILRREDVDPGVTAVTVSRVGRYAVQFQWSDGHSTGIYAYARLRGDEA